MAKTVLEYVKKWNVEAIITFDEGGVSGHINHRAVGAGVRYLSPRHLPLFMDPYLSPFFLRQVQRLSVLSGCIWDRR